MGGLFKCADAQAPPSPQPPFVRLVWGAGHRHFFWEGPEWCWRCHLSHECGGGMGATVRASAHDNGGRCH